jgi:tricorn protease
MAERGYFRYPSISGGRVVFVCEDDLWSVPSEGGRAERLTAGVAEVSRPCFSPDGTTLAFIGREEGPTEVFVMPAAGGPARRVTYQGSLCRWVGFSRDGSRLVYSTNAGRPFERDSWLNEVALDGGLPEELALGPATVVSYGPHRGVVMSRQPARDAFSWKRYRGGTAGTLWVDAESNGAFEPLVRLSGNLAHPCWVGERIYFLSDHEGHGNVYSCTARGDDLQRHTEHDVFYARNLASDGRRLVYHAGGELWLFDPRANETQRVAVEYHGPRTQRQRKFVRAERYVESVALHPDGTGVALSCRGRAYTMSHWEGPVSAHGHAGARYRLLTWLSDGRRLVAAVSGEDELERVVVLTADGSLLERALQHDLGRVVSLWPSPVNARVALSNHRNELWLLDIDHPENAPERLDQSRHARIAGAAFSADGRYLAYGFAETPVVTRIKARDLESGQTRTVTGPVYQDELPSFDPEGRYLYFIGRRDFDPVYDNMHFDLGFPKGMRPYAVALRKDVPSPFIPQPRAVSAKSASERDEGAAHKPAPRVEIDFDGIERRVVAFPVSEGRYGRVLGIRGAVLFSSFPVEGTRQRPLHEEIPAARGTLECYDFDTHKQSRIADSLSDFSIAPDRQTLLYRAALRWRVVPAAPKAPPKVGDTPGRQSGWLDLNRVKVSIDPAIEWRQMFLEGWRLQREHFWVEDMSGVDWTEVRLRYSPLVEAISSRSELSDLLWEVYGELGTSHAYEMGGDYRRGPNYRQGFLGADFEFDAARREYRIRRIAYGDPWEPTQTSPLNEPGIDVEQGDALVSINGIAIHAPATPQEQLVGQADNHVSLGVRRGEGPVQSVSVKALADERPARYRDWVEGCRRRVHEVSAGRVGYLHVPDMGANGFAEFHRGYLAELDRDALVVDVRFNRGGHVSSLLLEKLARRRVGYYCSRWEEPVPWPIEAPSGPLVALTNELAGSDGDIFSHAFKLLGLGPLVGKRTWGGVIGIHPRHRLADGTLTTQPEFSHWFDDVGWAVENYGTDPDVEVENTPRDYVAGVDRQLERAIELALAALEKKPPYRPKLTERPVLSIPRLTRRDPSSA